VWQTQRSAGVRQAQVKVGEVQAKLVSAVPEHKHPLSHPEALANHKTCLTVRIVAGARTQTARGRSAAARVTPFTRSLNCTTTSMFRLCRITEHDTVIARPSAPLLFHPRFGSQAGT